MNELTIVNFTQVRICFSVDLIEENVSFSNTFQTEVLKM
jgi:hypothetical protein